MRKTNFIILTILLLIPIPMLFIPSYDAIKIIPSTPLKIWLCICAINFVTSSIYYKKEKLTLKDFALTHTLPALIYFALFFMIHTTQNSPSFHMDSSLLWYSSYATYIIFCCTYQLIAYIKQLKPLSWAWICPLVPFFAIPLYLIAGDYIKVSLTPIGILVVSCLFVIAFAIVDYGLYKLDKLETPNHITQKFVWGYLLILVFACSTYNIYHYIYR